MTVRPRRSTRRTGRFEKFTYSLPPKMLAHRHVRENCRVMRFLLPLSCVVTAIGIAAPAHADINNDNDFLAQLRNAGITYQDRDLAITAGHSVCQLLDGGKSAAEIVTELRNRNPNFQGDGAADFTTLSASHFCPKYLTGEGRGPKPAQPAGN
jgi:hypothetical protein